LGDTELTVAHYAAQISLWALGVSAGAFLVSALALVLEFRRWLDEGVRLSLTVMVGARVFGGYERDENKYLTITVTNRGNAPTTITHFVLFNYPSKLARYVPRFLYRRIKWFHAQSFIVNSTGSPGPIPYVLEPGRMWMGRATQTPDLETMIEGGRLYVGIICSHSNKTWFKHVRREWKPPANAKRV
jgi:hypothetical protein